MKLYTTAILFFVFFIITNCTNGSVQNNSASGNKVITNDNADAAAPLSEKNKQIALKNEVTRAIEAAQQLEKQGRQMESYRLAADAEGKRACKSVGEDLQRQTKDLEAKIKSFPDPFTAYLSPFIGDLNACVACASPTAARASCVKARASVNEAIKKIYAAQ